MAKATFRDRQIAVRRLCLDAKGNLNRDAKLLAVHLKRICHGGRSHLVYSPVNGSIDPIATAAAAAKREVWEEIRRLLNLDDYADVNLREEP